MNTFISSLMWQVTMGVDAVVEANPVNWLATASQTLGSATVLPPQEGSFVESDAPFREQAASPQSANSLAHINSLEELQHTLNDFHGCSLRNLAMNLVFAAGNPSACTMIIGEAPGEEEDRQGLPFVGASGRLLDRMLQTIGLDRQTVYISNIVPWRPPGNRTPTLDEITACLPFMIRHIELIKPQILVLLGSTAIKSLLNEHAAIRRLRGRWYVYQSEGLTRPIATLVTFHPSYLLRSPSKKQEVWKDLLMLQEKLSLLRENNT